MNLLFLWCLVACRESLQEQVSDWEGGCVPGSLKTNKRANGWLGNLIRSFWGEKQ